MSLDTIASSHQQGEGIEIADFSVGDVNIGRITTADVDQVVGGYTYLAVPGGMRRGAVGISVEGGRNAFRFVVARTHPAAVFMRQRPRTGTVNVLWRYFERSDPSEVVPLFAGPALNMRRADRDHREILCEARINVIERICPRWLCGPNCSHRFGGSRCRVTIDDYAHETTIAAISGRTLTVADVDPSLPYGGGFVRYTGGDGITEHAWIERATDEAFLLDLPLYGAAVNDDLTIFPGCNQLLSTCATIYDNDENWGGRKDVPSKSAYISNVFS